MAKAREERDDAMKQRKGSIEEAKAKKWGGGEQEHDGPDERENGPTRVKRVGGRHSLTEAAALVLNASTAFHCLTISDSVL